MLYSVGLFHSSK